jgi:hypothetical protein
MQFARKRMLRCHPANSRTHSQLRASQAQQPRCISGCAHDTERFPLLSSQVVSAMEAVGIMELLTKWNLIQNPKVCHRTACRVLILFLFLFFLFFFCFGGRHNVSAA